MPNGPHHNPSPQWRGSGVGMGVGLVRVRRLWYFARARCCGPRPAFNPALGVCWDPLVLVSECAGSARHVCIASLSERARLKARTIPLGPSSMSLRCLSRGSQRIEMHGTCGWSLAKTPKNCISARRLPDPASSPIDSSTSCPVDVPRALLPSQCHRDPDT